MKYIFIDESGDLGFNFNKKKTSCYFGITLLLTEEKNILEKIVKKIFKGFKAAKMKHHPNTLHAYKESSQTKQKISKLISTVDMSVSCIYLDKKRIASAGLSENKHDLYNKILKTFLEKFLKHEYIPSRNPVTIILSRRETNTFLNNNLKADLLKMCNLRDASSITLEILSPSQSKGLQIVDFISWAIFRKYEYDDDTWYTEISKKIIDESLFNV